MNYQNTFNMKSIKYLNTIFFHLLDVYYIYIDANNQQEGKKARIISPMQTAGLHCLTFSYNINGGKVGALNIYLKTGNGSESLIFTKYTSNRRRGWQKAVIIRNTDVKFQVIFLFLFIV